MPSATNSRIHVHGHKLANHAAAVSLRYQAMTMRHRAETLVAGYPNKVDTPSGA